MQRDGSFSEEALAQFQELCAQNQSSDFSEGETYDFTRCMRRDGTFYGTSGSCKTGSQAGAKEKKAPKTEGGRKRSATAATKAAGAAERKAAGGAKRSDASRRARLLKDELEKVRERMRGADSETQNRLLREASAKADKRHAAGEDAGKRAEAREDSAGKVAAAKARRSVSELTPQERAARAARQAAKTPAADRETAREIKAANASTKKEIQDIKDEIKNRGPHTKEERAQLDQMLARAEKRLNQKPMTREQFQAGIKKMG
jgi:hypothetical protein